MRSLVAALCLATAACAMSDDPAEGGFFNGIAGLAGGGYQGRVVEREAAVASSQARGAELAAELAALQGEHRALKDRLAAQRARLRAQGLRLTPQAELHLEAALATEPNAADPVARAAALQRAIADARTLSEQLAELGA
jgi:hypothetical protein